MRIDHARTTTVAHESARGEAGRTVQHGRPTTRFSTAALKADAIELHGAATHHGDGAFRTVTHDARCFGATHTPDVHGSVLQHDALPVHAGGKQDRRAVTDAIDRLLNGLVVPWHADGATHALGEGAGPRLLGLVGNNHRAARAAQE